MTISPVQLPETQDDRTLNAHAVRVLPRLCETGAPLAGADGMQKAIVMRDMPDGSSLKTAVLDTTLAQALALKSWITCSKKRPYFALSYHQCWPGCLSGVVGSVRYAATANCGCAESQAPFTSYHMAAPEALKALPDEPKRVRYAASELPFLGLARRWGCDGKPFLSNEFVTAGERMREDFKLVQLGARIGQNWNPF